MYKKYIKKKKKNFDFNEKFEEITIKLNSLFNEII